MSEDNQLHRRSWNVTLGCCPFKDAYVAHMTQKPKLGDTMQLALSQIVVPTFTFTSFMVCEFQLCAPVCFQQILARRPLLLQAPRPLFKRCKSSLILQGL